ncbi:hypothetical protein PIROE2DRAFT_58748 [Piromyces sp. E2]|nr:hypothetical protein PIROE2DRAFT_58748 [Piromyces sp. E2]|eukprot:OUM67526.1 hypothetical protein PIROE2DRAFT_58748 [Piromyces sp. E2]
MAKVEKHDNMNELLKKIPHPIQYFPEELAKEYGTPRTDDPQNYSVYSPSLSSVSSMSSASSFQPPFITRGNSNLNCGMNYTTSTPSNQTSINLNIAKMNSSNIQNSPVKIITSNEMSESPIPDKSGGRSQDKNLLSPSSAVKSDNISISKEKQKIDFSGLHTLFIKIAGVENIFNLDCSSHRLVRIMSTLIMFIIYPELRRNLKQIASGPRGPVLAAEYITYYILCFRTVEHVSVTLPVLICAIIYIDRYVQQRKLRVASELGNLFQKLPDQYSRIAVTHV